MKLIGMVGLLLTVVVHAVAVPVTQTDRLVFQDLYGRDATLNAGEVSPACVLFFFSNTCPVARRYVPRMLQLAADYRARGVQFIAVNVSPDDPLEDVAQFAMEYGFTFPVVKDSTFNVVKALGVSRTPEVALLDKNFTKIYQGRVDDQYRLGGVRPEATRHDLADAVDALLEGRPVPASQVPAEGCVVTVPASEDSPQAPSLAADQTPYNVELACGDRGEEDKASGKRTWIVEAPRANVAWIKALRVDGAFQSAEFYYVETETEDRHYIAGALRPDQHVRWDEGDASRLPAGAALHLDTTGDTLPAPLVRMVITDTNPEWAIICTAHVFERDKGDPTRSLTILPQRPPYAQPRAISLDIGHYGGALTVEHHTGAGQVNTLLLLPALDPRRTGPHPMGAVSSALEGAGSLRATLQCPGYLTWPSTERAEADPERAITLFTYWAARP